LPTNIKTPGKMDTYLSSMVHFFDTLRDTVTSQPYATLGSEEVNSLIKKIDALVEGANRQCAEFEYACALREAVHNAINDGYFPIVVLPQSKYQAAISQLRTD
jgi:hypothetical protein